MRRRITTPLALSAAALLVLTSCSSDSDMGDSSALDGVEVEHQGEGETPEVTITDEIDTDQRSMRILETGDGEAVDTDGILEFRMFAADPETGEPQFENYSSPLPQMMWMPAFAEAPQPADQFIYEAFTSGEVSIGSELALYSPAEEGEEGGQPVPEELFITKLEKQYPAYATGEPQEQEDAELPQIINEIGEAPEIEEHDTDAEAPEELTSVVLSAGEGEEVNDDDYLFVQYRGWRWEDGEEFDGSWEEDGSAGAPFDFSMTGGVIEGWLEGLKGHHAGDRVMLVIPADQAYGETENEDGTTEAGSPGGALIFVVDIVNTIDAETMEAMHQSQQAQQQPDDISEEELQELLEQLEGAEGGSDEQDDTTDEEED